jgi:hypothetical protein
MFNFYEQNKNKTTVHIYSRHANINLMKLQTIFEISSVMRYDTCVNIDHFLNNRGSNF